MLYILGVSIIVLVDGQQTIGDEEHAVNYVSTLPWARAARIAYSVCLIGTLAQAYRSTYPEGTGDLSRCLKNIEPGWYYGRGDLYPVFLLSSSSAVMTLIRLWSLTVSEAKAAATALVTS